MRHVFTCHGMASVSPLKKTHFLEIPLLSEGRTDVRGRLRLSVFVSGFLQKNDSPVVVVVAAAVVNHSRGCRRHSKSDLSVFT